MKLSQRVWNGNRNPDEWQTSVLVPIFKEKGEVKNHNAYWEFKLL